MTRRSPPEYTELQLRCDEVLHYLWDPIGVAGEACARDEYETYVPRILRMVLEGASRDEIARALVRLQVEHIGVSDDRTRASAAAEALVAWREQLLGGES